MPKRARRKGYAELNVPNHAHCEVCGRVIALGEKYCSLKCEEKVLERRRAEERYRKIWLAILVILLIMMIVPMIFQFFIGG